MSWVVASSFILFSFHHFHQMRDLGNHPAHFLRVHALGHAIHLAEAEGFERLAHLARAADAAPDLPDADRVFLLSGLLRAHASPSEGALLFSLPRSLLY